MAYVISDDCVMCGTCAGECPSGAISEGDGKYVIHALMLVLQVLLLQVSKAQFCGYLHIFYDF